MNGVHRRLAALPAILAIVVIGTGISIAQQPTTLQKKKAVTQKKPATNKRSPGKRSVSRGKKSVPSRSVKRRTIRLPDYAIEGGYIISQSAQGSFRGTIVIRNGRITDVGPKVKVPAGMRKINATGTIITPGFIDANGSLWLTPAARREKSSRGSLNILDGIDQYADDWFEVIRHGVTAVYVQPRGSYGGNGALLRVGPGNRTSQLFHQTVAGVQASFGVESGSGSGHYSTLRSALSTAKKGSKRRLNPLTKTTNHARILARMVLSRRTPLVIEAHKSSDIENALKLAGEFKAKVILAGLSEPGESLKKLRQRRVPLIVGPLVELEGNAPKYRANRKSQWLTELLKEKPRFAIGTFSNHVRGSKFLRVQAAAAVAQGLSPQQVLKALTIDAATIFGVDKQIGSIEKGKYADLVCYLGDPLDPAAKVYAAFAKGELVYSARKTRVRGRPRRQRARGLPANPGRSYAIRSQRFLSESGTFSPQTMVVQEGVITAIGSTVKVPPGLPIYDVQYGVVTPGLVAAQTTLNLSRDIDGSTGSDELHIRATDGFDPSNKIALKLARGGFVSLGFAPSSRNVVAGSVGVVRAAATPCVLTAHTASKFVLSAAARNRSRFPASLSGQSLMVNSTLGGNRPYTNVFLPAPVLLQLRKDRATEISALRSRKRVALFEAKTRAEVTAAVRIIQQYRLRASIIGPEDLRPFVSILRQLKIGLVIPAISAAQYDRTTVQVAALANNGVPVGFAASDPDQIRASAAVLVRLGMQRSRALAALTHGAATTMGMPGWVGRLTKGGKADFVVWSGSPLDLAARPLSVICDGKTVSLK